jgi:hypothetical protein
VGFLKSDEHAEDYISDNICDRCHLRPNAEGKVTLKYLLNGRGKPSTGEFTTKSDKYMPADVEFGTKHTSGPPGSRVDTPPSLQRDFNHCRVNYRISVDSLRWVI